MKFRNMACLAWVLTWVGAVPSFVQTACAAPPDRLQRIASSHTLRVCIWPDYYGISFRNPKTQQLTGIDIDNANDVATALGAKAQFVDSSFATLIDDLHNDRCDIAMFAIGITPQRQNKLRFTQPPPGQRHLRHHHQKQPPHPTLGRHRPSRRGGGRGQRHPA